jgi:hypothetical protein
LPLGSVANRCGVAPEGLDLRDARPGERRVHQRDRHADVHAVHDAPARERGGDEQVHVHRHLDGDDLVLERGGAERVDGIGVRVGEVEVEVVHPDAAHLGEALPGDVEAEEEPAAAERLGPSAKIGPADVVVATGTPPSNR